MSDTLASSSSATGNAKGENSTNVSAEITTKSLATQVMQLASLVKQNTRLMIQHGEDIMRIDASRMGISSTTGEPIQSASAQPGQDEMIGELVQELQTKLDELEERSVRRTANSHVREPSDLLEWMPSPDPDSPEPSSLTLDEFEKIGAKDLLNSMKFYGLAHYEEGMPLPTEREFVDLFNECARFLGVSSRKRHGQVETKT